MMTVKENIKRSQQAFVDVVWPAIAIHCGGGSVISVETVSESSFAVALDALSGIDQWQQLEDPDCGSVLRGLASRVQWSKEAYATFTLRRSLGSSGKPTEYQKRLAALNGRGYLFPHLTIHAYLDFSDDILQVGIAKTEDILAAVQAFRWRTNPKDGNTFFWIPWKDVKGIKAINPTGAPHAP